MKHVLSQETQEKITNSIIQMLAEENCTLANYEEIHELVIEHYKNNATLSNLVSDTKAKKTTSHTKRQSIIDKAKSIAFDSCDDHIHKLCDEIIELMKG